MKKSYNAPKTESIIIKANIIAASTGSRVRSSSSDSNNNLRNSDWGNIWNDQGSTVN